MVDFEIREALCDYLDENRKEKLRMIDEFVIGKARADIVTVANYLTGYEIKGDTDSYTRLPMQVKEYNRFFQENYLVVGASHRKSADKHVPEFWGIICISKSESGEIKVETMRSAMANPRFLIRQQLRLLWRTELAHILKNNGLLKCSGKNKIHITNYLLERIPKERLQKQICEELFERDWTMFQK